MFDALKFNSCKFGGCRNELRGEEAWSPGASSDRDEMVEEGSVAREDKDLDNSGDEEGKKGGACLFWFDHMIMILIEVMKAEHHMAEQDLVRARKESDKMKFLGCSSRLKSERLC
ncbi:hypothetical protein R1sor_009657 [Riccia sorocarpa]|uniref:Uncharacterized protein n=1 Tax=Riccia sorocarpa TaxID=122646 RepID=A0ABD3HX85_9MARC